MKSHKLNKIESMIHDVFALLPQIMQEQDCWWLKRMLTTQWRVKFHEIPSQFNVIATQSVSQCKVYAAFLGVSLLLTNKVTISNTMAFKILTLDRASHWTGVLSPGQIIFGVDSLFAVNRFLCKLAMTPYWCQVYSVRVFKEGVSINTPMQLSQHLVDSMPRRIASVIQTSWGATPY